METVLSGKKICILVASGFAEEQFSQIQKMLNKSGAVIKTVAPENGLVHGWLENGWGHYFPVDVQIAEAMGSDFDRIIIPGGARAIEKLKSNLHTRRILRHFFEAQKPIIAIEEASDLLTLCEQVSGLEVSVPTAQLQSVKASGAIVASEPVTIDGHLLTYASLNEDWLEVMVQHLAEETSLLRAA